MLEATSNPREVIGGNFPPEPTAIDRAEPFVASLRITLDDVPVLVTDEDARKLKAALDPVKDAMDAMEAERKAKIKPLQDQEKATNAEYFRFHHYDPDKRPGLWDKLYAIGKDKLSRFLAEQERKLLEAQQAAFRAKQEAEQKARDAARAAEEAQAMAAVGVCDTDEGGAVEKAHEAKQEAVRADITSRRLDGSKVRVAGGSRNAISLRDVETLHVTDWRAAIEEMGLSQGIADAIIKSARAYRKLTDALPSGVEATFERGL